MFNKKGSWYLAASVTLALATVLVSVMEWRQAEGGSDISAPELKSLAFEPTTIDTTNSARVVTVTLALEDETGVCAKVCNGDVPTQIMLQHVGSTQTQWASAFELVSGSFTDGVFEDDLVFPQGSAKGTWEVGFFRLIDNLGNFIDLESDLAEMGFPTYIVNGSGGGGPTPAPTATVPPIITPTPTPTLTPTPIPSPTPTQTPAITSSPSPTPVAPGDVDCDGDSDAVDALAILRYVAGLPYVQAPGCQPLG